MKTELLISQIFVALYKLEREHWKGENCKMDPNTI